MENRKINSETNKVKKKMRKEKINKVKTKFKVLKLNL